MNAANTVRDSSSCGFGGSGPAGSTDRRLRPGTGNVAFRAGDVLVVARKNHTAVTSTSKTIRELAATGARVVGTVVNEY